MTERETDAYREQRALILLRANWQCEVCGAPLDDGNTQLAHRIPQRKHWVKAYGKDVIHHPANLAATCSEKCNAAVSVGESEEAHKRVLQEINDYVMYGGIYDRE